jgi:hypothetical protein
MVTSRNTCTVTTMPLEERDELDEPAQSVDRDATAGLRVR